MAQSKGAQVSPDRAQIDTAVGALRARAAAKGVDTSPRSSGGARPLADDRPVTSGDIMAMMKDQADQREAA